MTSLNNTFTFKTTLVLLSLLSLLSCNERHEDIKPVYKPISASVYASGTIKSADQYQAFATASGVIQEVYVKEGDTVRAGEPLLRIGSEEQRLRRGNAALDARFSDYNFNIDKLNDVAQQIALAESKLRNDSALYFRQRALWDQQVGTRVELEQRQLNYEGAKAALYSARVRYNDLNRQLRLASMRAKTNLRIASRQEDDFVLTSKLNGTVYDLYKRRGEQVSPQTPLALIGGTNHFLAEMRVDEDDIAKVKLGQLVLITIDSYEGQVFEATLTKIYPVLDGRSRTFLAEAEFKQAPQRIFPNVSFEANIVIATKSRALLVPRNYVLHDSLVITVKKDTIRIKTGLKDYRMIEVLSGITDKYELLKPRP